MIINFNIFKVLQIGFYFGLFVFMYYLLENNPLNNIFFYLMVLCMIGIDYTSYYNGVITGSNKAIIKFVEEINKRENKLEEIESREVNCK